MRFTKMHGLGNDYIYIDVMNEPELEHLAWPELSVAMSERRTSIGADGVILICPSRDAAHHARMRTFNADGSESDACGNGTRCVAKYVHERLGIRDEILLIESGDRVLACEPDDQGQVRVAMGRPGLDLTDCAIEPAELVSSEPMSIDIDGEKLVFTAISMGNPHAVAFVADNRWLGSDLAMEIRRFGPQIERHPAFTERINAHLVRVDDKAHATVHTWERGAGPTRACGTGACATHVAAALAGRLDREATMTLPGGNLLVSWTPVKQGGDGIVRQTGPAEFVFDGQWSVAHEGMTA